MADRTIKPDDTNDLVLQNNDGSAKLELNEDQTVKVTTGSDAGEDFTVNTSQLVVEGDTGNVGIGTSASFGGSATKKYLSILNTDGTDSADRPAVIELASSNKGDGVRVGEITAISDVDGGDDEIVSFVFAQDGTTTNNVGGKIRLQTKADGGALADRMVVDQSGSITTPNGEFNGTIGSSATFQNYSILQIQFGSYASEATSSSTTYDDLAGSSFQVSITPSSTSNKILITCTAEIEVANNDCHVVMDFYRNIGGTEVHFLLSNDGSGQGAGQFRGKENLDRGVITWCFVDSPSTTSQIIYRPTLKRRSGSGLFYIGAGATGTNTITAMEIKQ